MRLDHLLSREEEVEEREVLFSYEGLSGGERRENFKKFLVVMRLGGTPVLIPNTMVKT